MDIIAIVVLEKKINVEVSLLFLAYKEELFVFHVSLSLTSPMRKRALGTLEMLCRYRCQVG